MAILFESAATTLLENEAVFSWKFLYICDIISDSHQKNVMNEEKIFTQRGMLLINKRIESIHLLHKSYTFFYFKKVKHD